MINKTKHDTLYDNKVYCTKNHSFYFFVYLQRIKGILIIVMISMTSITGLQIFQDYYYKQ